MVDLFRWGRPQLGPCHGSFCWATRRSATNSSGRWILTHLEPGRWIKTHLKPGGSMPTPSQSERPTTRDPADQPSSSMGAGDNTWASWHQRVMQESRGRMSEPQGPPFPIASAQVRWESVGQIYGWVHGKNPPDSNIISKALQAYYTRVYLLTLHTWACQALCMIAE